MREKAFDNLLWSLIDYFGPEIELSNEFLLFLSQICFYIEDYVSSRRGRHGMCSNNLKGVSQNLTKLRHFTILLVWFQHSEATETDL